MWQRNSLYPQIIHTKTEAMGKIRRVICKDTGISRRIDKNSGQSRFTLDETITIQSSTICSRRSNSTPTKKYLYVSLVLLPTFLRFFTSLPSPRKRWPKRFKRRMESTTGRSLNSTWVNPNSPMPTTEKPSNDSLICSPSSSEGNQKIRLLQGPSFGRQMVRIGLLEESSALPSNFHHSRS